MGAVNSANAPTMPRGVAPAIPADLIQYFLSAFLSSDPDMGTAIQAYYASNTKDNLEGVRNMSRYMTSVNFIPADGRSTLELLNLFGPVPITRLERENTLQMERLLTQGTFGKVWVASINSHPIVVKVGRGRDQQGLLEEALLTLMITSDRARACFQHHVDTLGVTGVDRYPFPHINFVIKNGNTNKRKLMVGMEKFDVTLWDLVAKEDQKVEELDFVDILAQIFQMLYMAQETFGFVHKDFKANNIMLIRRPQRIEIIRRIGVDGRPFAMSSAYTVVFIDLGTSCASLSACGVNVSIENINDTMQQSTILCSNRSFDCLQLLFTLIPMVPILFSHFAHPEKSAVWWENFVAPVNALARENGLPKIVHDSYLVLYNQAVFTGMKSDATQPQILFNRLMESAGVRAGQTASEVQAAQAQARAHAHANAQAQELARRQQAFLDEQERHALLVQQQHAQSWNVAPMDMSSGPATSPSIIYPWSAFGVSK